MIGGMTIQVSRVDYQSAIHRDAIVHLLASYAEDPAAGGEAISDYCRDNVVEGVRQHPASLVLMAEVEAEVVGMALCFWGYGTFAARPLLNLHDLVVDPHWRGRGVGGKLLEAVEQAAREADCCFVTLEVSGLNPGAQRLYRRHGFDGGEAIDPPDKLMFWKKRLD